MIEGYTLWQTLGHKEKEIWNHLVRPEVFRESLLLPHPDSHKGDNGRVLVVGGSPLFHGAGHLATKSADKINSAITTIIDFSSRTNDMVYFCSTPHNLLIQQAQCDTFIGITRSQFDAYFSKCDAVLVGPGLMREADIGRPDTEGESNFTRMITDRVLSSDKKTVLDAGSLQVISSESLRGKNRVIITPHRVEMKNLFGFDNDHYFFVSQNAEFSQIETVAQRVQAIAEEFKITILLKGPIDIIAGSSGWFFSPGGSPAMTKGGTGDVLAGVCAALYSRINEPLVAAAAASYILKRTGENLQEEKSQFFDAGDLADNITRVLIQIFAK